MKLQVLASVLLFIALSCNTTDPPNTGETFLQLEALDSSCTETWLQVKLAAAASQRTITLQRDSLTILTTTLTGTDTLIVDEGLLPNRQYTYTLTRQNGSFTEKVTASIGTMDTTSHDWSFSIDTLGDGAGSVLYDVAIISDTLAYAVGAIYKRDSLGNWDPHTYNLVKWDGSIWELMRIQFYTFCGQSGTGSYPAKSIFAFSPTDIWIGMDGSQVVHWNGQNQSAPTCTPVSINKLWGDSSTGELYAVGNGGGIGIRSPTGTWRRLESGTTLPIWDIFGARNESTGQNEMVCVASNHNFPEGRKLLRIQGSSAIALPDSGLPWSIDAVWFKPGRRHIVVGDSVWRVNRLGSKWTSIRGLPNLYTTAIAGTGFNDMTIVGAFWNFLHFNGSTWRSYFPFASGSFTSVAMKGNEVIAVGGSSNRAVAVRGRR